MKKNVLSALFVLIFASLLFTNNAFAGAWTVPKHKVWLEYYTVISYATKYFNSSGHLTAAPTSGAKSFKNQVLTMEPKIEFGVTDWLTALASFESKEAQDKEYGVPARDPYNNVILPHDHTVKNHAIVNVKVGGRWRIIDKPFVLSTQTKVFIATNYGVNSGNKTLVGRRTYLEDRRYLPTIGYGNDSLEQRIMIGKTFSIPMTERFKLPCYAGAELGYRWNNKGVRNGVPWYLEGGFWPFPWLLLKTELDAYRCQDGDGQVEGSYGIWRTGAVWQIFGGDSVLRQGNKLFNLEFLYGMTIWGKNTKAYNEYVMKVQTQF